MIPVRKRARIAETVLKSALNRVNDAADAIADGIPATPPANASPGYLIEKASEHRQTFDETLTRFQREVKADLRKAVDAAEREFNQISDDIGRLDAIASHIRKGGPLPPDLDMQLVAAAKTCRLAYVAGTIDGDTLADELEDYALRAASDLADERRKHARRVSAVGVATANTGSRIFSCAEKCAVWPEADRLRAIKLKGKYSQALEYRRDRHRAGGAA